MKSVNSFGWNGKFKVRETKDQIVHLSFLWDSKIYRSKALLSLLRLVSLEEVKSVQGKSTLEVQRVKPKRKPRDALRREER